MLVFFDNEQQLLEIKIIDLFVMLKKRSKKSFLECDRFYEERATSL